GQDEDRRRQVGVERLVLGADGEVAEQADDRQPVDVVVERTQRLGQEERQETSLPQQVELRMMVGRHASPEVWREPSKRTRIPKRSPPSSRINLTFSRAESPSPRIAGRRSKRRSR